MAKDYRRLIAPPWLAKIELVRGCNLACRFCPIYALPAYSEHPEYLAPELCQWISAEIRSVNDHVRIELTMRGEPTLHPHVVDCVRAIRAELPKSQVSMFTNGVMFLKSRPSLPAELITAGVNILNIDCYNDTWARFQKVAAAVTADHPDIRVTDFRRFSAYRRYPSGHRLRVINLVPDIADPDNGVAVRVIHNNAGNSDPLQLQEHWGISPLTAPLQKKCVRPFRELVFTYDGSVVICCHDWKAESVLGKVPPDRVAEIWYGERHWQILRSLYRRDRSGVPCNKCDYHGGYRQGFLRNPTSGK